MEILSKSPQDTKEFAYSLVSKLKEGDVLALYGDLGSGKTTFTRYLTEALGSQGKVQSPTFVVHRKYHPNGSNLGINHLDLYRLTTEEDINDLGLHEIFNEPGYVSVVEWPEIAKLYLPENTKHIKFEYVDENTRKIYVQN